MKCFLRTFSVGFAVAFALTLIGSPAVNRWLWYHIPPSTPEGWAPKYRIGGQDVTFEQFKEHMERTTG